MAAARTVTLEEVVEAGRLIVAQGRRVSGGALRNEIGRGEGARLLGLWQQAQTEGHAAAPDNQPGQSATDTLPPAMAELTATLRDKMASELLSAIVAAWTLAERTAIERLAAEMAFAVERAASAQAEVGELTQAAKKIDRAYEQMQAAAEQARDAAVLANQRAVAAEASQTAAEARAEHEQQRASKAEQDLRAAFDRAARAEALAEERSRMLTMLTPAPTSQVAA